MTDRKFLINGLKFHVFPEHPSSRELVDLHNSVYDFWSSMWTQTLKELDHIEALPSDDFLRQDERCFLTFRDEIIGYISFTWFDLNQPSNLQHSYFKTYPADALDELRNQGLSKAMVMSWLCIAPTWRRTSMGPLVNEVLLFQAYNRFRNSDSDTLIAFTRNNRKMNDLCYLYGSKCLRSNLREHNVDIDVIYTLKQDVRDNPDPLIHETANQLWAERIIHTDAQIQDSRKRAA